MNGHQSLNDIADRAALAEPPSTAPLVATAPLLPIAPPVTTSASVPALSTASSVKTISGLVPGVHDVRELGRDERDMLDAFVKEGREVQKFQPRRAIVHFFQPAAQMSHPDALGEIALAHLFCRGIPRLDYILVLLLLLLLELLSLLNLC